MPDSFFNKVAGLGLKKGTPAQVFSCEFCEISKNTFSYRTSPVAASDFRLASRHVPLTIFKASSTVIFLLTVTLDSLPILVIWILIPFLFCKYFWNIWLTSLLIPCSTSVSA